MKIYAKIGESDQTIDSRAKPKCPIDNIEMKEERPFIDPKVEPDMTYVAAKGGAWVKVKKEVTIDE